MGNQLSVQVPKLNFNFKSLMDLTTNAGWTISWESKTSLSTDSFDGVFVGVLGEYKKGKTSVFNWLKAAALETTPTNSDNGSVVDQTSGVNFSFVTAGTHVKNKIAFIDTTGLNTPVECLYTALFRI